MNEPASRWECGECGRPRELSEFPDPCPTCGCRAMELPAANGGTMADIGVICGEETDNRFEVFKETFRSF